MQSQELKDIFRDECSTLAALVAAKNQNYSGTNGAGAFSNFELIEAVTNGKISREVGAFVRLTDKLARIWALIDGNPDQVGESFGDTAIDLAGYAILLKLMYEESAAKRLEAFRAAPVEQGQGAVNHLKDFQNSGTVHLGAQPGAELPSPEPAVVSAWERLTRGLRA